jgi:PAS domain S-box-containing protein
MVCLLVAGVWFYNVQERQMRQDAEAGLSAIAQLKAEQIVNWRAERLADARALQESPFLVEELAHWLKAPQPETTEQILDRFRSLQVNYGYFNVLLVEDNGKVRLSLAGPMDTLYDDAARALAKAFREKRATLSDLHAGPGDLPPHICSIAPLFTENGEKAQPVGAVILQCDARQFLYPLIEFWPVESRSAETLLVRRDGDSVLFLNELRHRKDTALTLRIPLNRQDLPTVQAALGKDGIFYGQDYRGVKVLAVLKPIPDSLWFLVAKIDRTEALAAWRFQSILILALIFGPIAATAAGAGIVWQNQQKAHYVALNKAEAAQAKSEAYYRMTLLSVGDGVIITDKDGRVELMNPVAEELTGWKLKEALGRQLEEVFHIINEETRQAVENPIQRVIGEGVVIGLANHTLLISRDGTEYAVADSGSPIRNNEDEIIGVVVVFKDQTEERIFQKRLAENEEKFHSVYENATIGLYRTSPEGKILMANAALLQMMGYDSLAELQGRNLEEEGFEPDYPRQEFRREVEEKGEIRGLESAWKRRDGTSIFIRESSRVVRDEGQNVLYYEGTVEDVTERKRMEIGMRENEEKYRNVVERAQEGITIIQDTRVKFANESLARMWGGTVEEIIDTPFADYVHPDEMSMVADLYRRRLAGEDVPAKYETVLKRKDGGKVDAEINSGLIPYLGKPALLVIIRDISDRKLAEEALRKERTLLRTLINALPDYIYAKDLESRFITANWAHLRAVGGKSLDDMIGKSDFELFPRELAQKYYADEQQVIQNGRSLQDREERVVEHSGEEKWVLTTKVPMRDNHGNVVGLVGISRDITERKRAEEDLKAERHLFHTLMDNIPDAIYFKDPESRFVRINRAQADRFELEDPSQAVGKTDSDFFTEEHAQQASKDELLIVQSGEPIVDKEEKETWPDGRVGWVSTTKMPLFDLGGRIVGTFGVSHDITERKQALEALSQSNRDLQSALLELEQSRKMLRLIIESIPIRVFWKDRDLRYLGCNMALAQDAGFSDPQELLGQDDFAMSWKEQAEIYRADDKMVMDSGQPRMHIIEPQTTPTGATIWLSTSKVPLKTAGGDILGILGIYEDITVRKQDEEALKAALQERDVMLREIHHRVKNNIQIISSLLRLQSRNIKDEKALEMLNESQNRIKSMALIHEKLYQSQDFARIDFSDYIDKMVTHLFAMYNVEAGRVRSRVEAKNIQLDINRAIPCGLIINELVTNALKHAFPEGKEGELLIRMGQKEGDTFELSVKDTGVGLPLNLDPSKTKTLGMQIVRDLVKQLGGSIQIQRSAGTEFVIRI